MIHYTALGDSITYGLGASDRMHAYPERTVAILQAKGCPTRLFALAKPGWTSENLMNQLALHDLAPIERASFVSIWIGGDDLIRSELTSVHRPASANTLSIFMEEYRCNLTAIIQKIKTISAAQIICCTQYNPFPNNSLAVKGVNMLNRETIQTAKRCRVLVAPAHEWFEGKESKLIKGYRDGKLDLALALRGHPAVHPNDLGYLTIAKGLAPMMISQK